jgi:hypothetical protein
MLSIKQAHKLKGQVADVTRLDGKTFRGQIVLEEGNEMVKILAKKRGRPARFHRILITNITLVEAEAAQTLAQELAEELVSV